MITEKNTIMKIFNKWQFAFVLTILIGTGCNESFLDETSIALQTADSYFKTEVGFEDLVRSTYPLARDICRQGRLVLLGTDVFSQGHWDEAAGVDPGDALNVYNEGLGSSLPELELFWDLLYREIARTNTVTSRAGDVTGMDEGLKAIRVGEAKFLRALSYFYLVQTWGDVPMPLTETVGPSKEVIRVASADVYTQIIKDATEAEAVLPVTPSDYGRATKGAAQFLLARIYLTRGWNYNNSLGGVSADFDKALDYADNVIAAYPLAANYTDLFPARNDNPLFETNNPATQDDQNPEIVFAVQYSSDVLTYSGDPTNPGASNGNDLHSLFGGSAEDIPGNLARSSHYNRHLGKYITTPATYRMFDPDIDTRYTHNFLMRLYALKDAPGHVPAAGVPPIDILKGDTVILFRAWNNPAALADKGLDVGGTKRYAVINTDEFERVEISSYHSKNKTPMMWKFWEPNIPYGDDGGTFDFALFRSAEAYLIAAEAIVKGASGGSLGGAENYYNAVLDRALGANAGTDPLQAAVPEDVMDLTTASYRATAGNIDIDMILDERARELMGEYVRWFDLKRTGKLIERGTKYNPWIAAKGKIAAKHYLRPIPLHEIDRASNAVTQNTGY